MGDVPGAESLDPPSPLSKLCYPLGAPATQCGDSTALSTANNWFLNVQTCRHLTDYVIRV
jgi:hypothetical protein